MSTPQRRSATDEMRSLARLRAVIDPLDLAIGQTFQREEIAAGKAARFTYFGKARYVSHEGTSPMSVVFEVR